MYCFNNDISSFLEMLVVDFSDAFFVCYDRQPVADAGYTKAGRSRNRILVPIMILIYIRGDKVNGSNVKYGKRDFK